VPMFLFSGTFFPVSQLPGWMQPIAWAVPLWHGVDLCRDLVFGTATWGMAVVHVGYLALWVTVSFVVARHFFTKRLVT
jgi:lipooligosaccharide transport system permease protein